MNSVSRTEEIIDNVIVDIWNYPDVGATVPRSTNGPVIKRIQFPAPIHNVKSIELTAVNVINPHFTQTALMSSTTAPWANQQRDPYLLVNLAGFRALSRTYINGYLFQGGVVMGVAPDSLGKCGLNQPTVFIQNTLEPGMLGQLEVEVSRPPRTDYLNGAAGNIPTLNSGGTAVTSTETDASPLFDRLVLAFRITRLGPTGVYSKVQAPAVNPNLMDYNIEINDSRNLSDTMNYQQQRRF